MNAKQWNDKWPKDRVTYNARSSADRRTRIVIDVRNYIWSKSVVLDDVVNMITKPDDTYDDAATKITRWVQSTIKYVGDKQSSGTNEFWQFPTETLALRIGDCEDMSILIVSLMRVACIPAYRIKVAAGLVRTGKNAETGGHAYPVYLRESDENWVVLDPCYYPVRTHAKKRPLHKNMKKYKDIWFTFNDEYSWAQKSFNLTKRIK